MKNNKMRMLGLLLAGSLILGTVTPVQATTDQAAADTAQTQSESLNSNAAASQTSDEDASTQPASGNAAVVTDAAGSDNAAQSSGQTGGGTASDTNTAGTGASDGTASDGTTGSGTAGSSNTSDGSTAGGGSQNSSTSAGDASGQNNGTAAESGSTSTQTDTEKKDISGSVTVDSDGKKDVSGSVTVETDKNDDNVEIKKNDKPYLALGENLTDEQRATVLSLMGIDPSKLSDYDVLTVNNTEEHQYLDSYIDKSKIGTKSLSSVVIMQRKKGNGINISTYNISYCTVGMYKNALATAGIEDADIIVAGPFPLSGTAALVGIFKAYTEMTGDTVDEENIDAAVHELVITGQLENSGNNDPDEVENMIAYVKQAVVEHDMSNEADIRDAIDEGCDKFQVTLTEDEKNQIVQLMLKINDLNLNVDDLINAAQSIYDKFGNDAGFWSKLLDTLSSILDKIGSIFGSKK